MVQCRLADMPPDLNWRRIYGAAILAGIGFTMALFISDLAIQNDQLLGFSKLSILVASSICAVGGYLVLRRNSGS